MRRFDAATQFARIILNEEIRYSVQNRESESDE